MANDTLFRERAPLIMRRLMSEFAIDATSAAAIVGNLGHESGGFRDLQEKKPLVPRQRPPGRLPIPALSLCLAVPAKAGFPFNR